MALIHEFAIIQKDCKEFIIRPDMDRITIADEIIVYIKDTLEWLLTIWNGKYRKGGLNYYGYYIIEGNNINKLLEIIKAWKTLFELSPEEFYISGNYNLEQKEYIRIKISKRELVRKMNELINLCKNAISMNCWILHNGI